MCKNVKIVTKDTIRLAFFDKKKQIQSYMYLHWREIVHAYKLRGTVDVRLSINKFHGTINGLLYICIFNMKRSVRPFLYIQNCVI